MTPISGRLSVQLHWPSFVWPDVELVDKIISPGGGSTACAQHPTSGTYVTAAASSVGFLSMMPSVDPFERVPVFRREWNVHNFLILCVNNPRTVLSVGGRSLVAAMQLL